MPAYPGVEFGAFYQTSRHAGGDYYDVFTIDPGRFGVMVADVSGHGAPAAIVMAMIRAVLHARPDLWAEPAAVMHHINRHFAFLWETAMFATAVYGVLDVPRRTWTSVRAGHPPPLLVGPNRTVGPAACGDARMLLFDDLGALEAVEQRLAPGDRLVLFTDGLPDRETPDGRLYDLDRLSAAAGRYAGLAPADLVAAIVADAEVFTGGHEADDDQTLLVIGIGETVNPA
jgi:sigma-B regulation protein RsbU (phosphoserine phosphatase)